MKATWLPFMLAGCAVPGDTDHPAPEHGTSVLLVDTVVVDFGEVPVAAGPTSRAVTLRNAGDAALHLGEVAVDDPEAFFSASLGGAEMLPPGGRAQIEITFAPPTWGDWVTVVSLTSDDPATPEACVTVAGSGLAPELTLEPAALDLGTVTLGCTAGATLSVGNTGYPDLTVEEITLDDPGGAMALEYPPDLPLVIVPRETLTLAISYSPLAERSDEATLTLRSDDTQTPEVEVPISAEGLAEGWGLDSFVQEADPALDILVAVDTSASMSRWDTAGQLTAFATTARAMGADFRLGATVADDGCLHGPWIDASTADVPAAVAGMLAPGPGSNAERAFMLLEAALAETPPGGRNEGFLREENRLSLVGISDEPDQSVDDWSTYLARFQALRADPADVVVDAVGGQYLSLCDPAWGPALAPTAAAVDGRRNRFRLNAPPIPATIAVTVDGLPEARWSYAEATQAVVFDPDAVPEEGAEIAISYAVQVHCEG